MCFKSPILQKLNSEISGGWIGGNPEKSMFWGNSGGVDFKKLGTALGHADLSAHLSQACSRFFK
jgi:hypothetical protein